MKTIKYFFIRIFTNTVGLDVPENMKPLKLGQIVITTFDIKYKYLGNDRYIVIID